MSTATERLARDALRLAEDQPSRAVQLAAEAVAQARAERDPAAECVAERAWGLAAVHQEDLDAAVRHLRRAIPLGRRAGTPQLAAEARMTLAYVWSQRGRPTQALREIDVVTRDLDGLEGARARAQRGAILHRLGRFDEALAAYRAALPVLRASGDRLWMWRVLSNRGPLYARKFAFAAAEADLREAEQLCRDLGLDVSIGFTRQNLGFVKARRGEVPAALEYYASSELTLRRHGSQLGSLLFDRSEVLLSVRLVSEAREQAEQAVVELRRERRLIALPEVRLLLAQAALSDGDSAGAVREAGRAVREFARQRRPEWAALARLTVLIGRHAGGPGPRLSVRQIELAVWALNGAWPAAALEGELLAGRLALARHRPGRARELFRRASRVRRRGPATLRARGWYAEALLRLSEGNRRGAARAIRAGLSILDDHRAALGATDVRAHAAGHRTELARLGLGIALEDARPRRVFAWAELGRASHLMQRPARPPDDPAFADDLATLRGTVMLIEEARKTGRGAGRLVQRQVGLERRIRDHTRLRHGDPVDAPVHRVSPDDLAAALGEVALLEFVAHDGVLSVVSIVDGRLRLRALGRLAEVRDLVDRLPFALHRLIRHTTSRASRSAARTLLEHTAARLDQILLRPLPEVVGRPLVLVPTGPLQSLPWSILPSCAGRPVTVSPSASLWRAACTRPPAETGRVTVAAGPDLPAARFEAEAVAAIHGTTALLGPAATVGAVAAALNGANVAHFASHGRVRADNPLFSSLWLSDGPLMVYDLERLDRLPRTVVLAACDSGRPVVRAGDELLGLSATFLARGTTQLVAPVLPVPDAETAPVMIAFHRLLAAGQPAAVALASAQRSMATDATRMAVAAGFVCHGAGFVPSAPPGASPGFREAGGPGRSRTCAPGLSLS
ncbi:MAG TPA: CHAT domain-containing protein [Mycobacteriales bacterium]|nr:CHAT domain-containing protein [Mycobacteriales bacterium]